MEGSPISQLASATLDPLRDARVEFFPQLAGQTPLQHLLLTSTTAPIGSAAPPAPAALDTPQDSQLPSMLGSLFGPTFEAGAPLPSLLDNNRASTTWPSAGFAPGLTPQEQFILHQQLSAARAAFGGATPPAGGVRDALIWGAGMAGGNSITPLPTAACQQQTHISQAAPACASSYSTASAAPHGTQHSSWASVVQQGCASAPPHHPHPATPASVLPAPCARSLFGGAAASLAGLTAAVHALPSAPPAANMPGHLGSRTSSGAGALTAPSTPGGAWSPSLQQDTLVPQDPWPTPVLLGNPAWSTGHIATGPATGCFIADSSPICGAGAGFTPEPPGTLHHANNLPEVFDLSAGIAALLLDKTALGAQPGAGSTSPGAGFPPLAAAAGLQGATTSSSTTGPVAPQLPRIITAPPVPVLAPQQPVSPVTPPLAAGGGGGGRSPHASGGGQGPSRLRRCTSAFSSVNGGDDAFSSSSSSNTPSRRASLNGVNGASRLSSGGGGGFGGHIGAGAGGLGAGTHHRLGAIVGPCSGGVAAAAVLSGGSCTRLMWMDFEDAHASSYCLSGGLEPHKLWFGVGVHRAIRKLVTNNKRRHSLILALHASAGGRGGAYGDLGAMYGAVLDLHRSVASAAFATEAGMKMAAGVEELLELMQAALRDGPGNEDYRPAACFARARAG